jgi:hypothetical protein
MSHTRVCARSVQSVASMTLIDMCDDLHLWMHQWLTVYERYMMCTCVSKSLQRLLPKCDVREMCSRGLRLPHYARVTQAIVSGEDIICDKVDQIMNFDGYTPRITRIYMRVMGVTRCMETLMKTYSLIVPEGVKELHMGEFNPSCVVLPSTLVHLDMGAACTQTFFMHSQTSCLTFVRMSHRFNAPHFVLPPSVQTLYMGDAYDQADFRCSWNMKELYMGARFNQPLVGGKNIQTLVMGHAFNPPDFVLGEHVRSVVYGAAFNQPFRVLPSTLKQVRIEGAMSCLHEEVPFEWPHGLHTLECSELFEAFNRLRLPPTLTALHGVGCVLSTRALLRACRLPLRSLQLHIDTSLTHLPPTLTTLSVHACNPASLVNLHTLRVSGIGHHVTFPRQVAFLTLDDWKDAWVTFPPHVESVEINGAFHPPSIYWPDSIRHLYLTHSTYNAASRLPSFLHTYHMSHVWNHPEVCLPPTVVCFQMGHACESNVLWAPSSLRILTLGHAFNGVVCTLHNSIWMHRLPPLREWYMGDAFVCDPKTVLPHTLRVLHVGKNAYPLHLNLHKHLHVTGLSHAYYNHLYTNNPYSLSVRTYQWIRYGTPHIPPVLTCHIQRATTLVWRPTTDWMAYRHAIMWVGGVFASIFLMAFLLTLGGV